MNSVEDRLSKLERSNRGWRFIALLGFGITSLRVLTGASEPASFDILNAKRIQIDDPKGNVVGVLSGQGGFGAFALTSSACKSQIAFGATTQPGIVITNAGGNNVVALLANDDDAGDVSVFSAAGKERVQISGRFRSKAREPGDSAGIGLSAENGEKRAGFMSDGESASLTLTTHEGKGAVVALIASDVHKTCVAVKQPGGGGVSSLP